MIEFANTSSYPKAVYCYKIFYLRISVIFNKDVNSCEDIKVLYLPMVIKFEDASSTFVAVFGTEWLMTHALFAIKHLSGGLFLSLCRISIAWNSLRIWPTCSIIVNLPNYLLSMREITVWFKVCLSLVFLLCWHLLICLKWSNWHIFSHPLMILFIFLAISLLNWRRITKSIKFLLFLFIFILIFFLPTILFDNGWLII